MADTWEYLTLGVFQKQISPWDMLYAYTLGADGKLIQASRQPLSEALQWYGAQGWELVGAGSTHAPLAPASGVFLLFFKRHKS